jgi:hypothetical protein
LKTLRKQHLDNAPAAPAANIDCIRSVLGELQGSFMLCNAVLSIELIAIPVMGDLIVAAGYFGWFHR